MRQRVRSPTPRPLKPHPRPLTRSASLNSTAATIIYCARALYRQAAFRHHGLPFPLRRVPRRASPPLAAPRVRRHLDGHDHRDGRGGGLLAGAGLRVGRLAVLGLRAPVRRRLGEAPARRAAGGGGVRAGLPLRPLRHGRPHPPAVRGGGGRRLRLRHKGHRAVGG